jgi:hypothetical protein
MLECVQMTLQTNTVPSIRNTSEIKTGEQQPSLSQRLMKLVNHVGRSEEYGDLRSQKKPHTEAFRGAIDKITNSPDNGFNNFDTALLNVTANLGTFIEAETTLDAIKDRREENGHYADDDYARSKSLKLEHVIPFNHSLKSLINEGPNMNMHELSASLARTHEAVFNRYNNLNPTEPKDPYEIVSASDVTMRLERIMNGMRHEIATETMLSAAGLDYSYDISPKEDADGVDIIAMLPRPNPQTGNIRTVRVPIDIKSSFVAEQRSRDKHPTAIAVWTELDDSDFTGIKGDARGALSIPYSAASEHADSFVDRVQSIMTMAEEYKSQASKHIGHAARR